MQEDNFGEIGELFRRNKLNLQGDKTVIYIESISCGLQSAIEEQRF